MGSSSCNKYGIRYLYDVKGYIKGADHILANHKIEDFHHVFYIVHISLIALGKSIFGGSVVPNVVFQILLSGAATLALYFSSTRLFNSANAGLLTALFFLLWLDCIHWNTVLLSESLFCSIIIFLLAVIIHFKGRLKDFVGIGVLSLFLMFTRPTSVVVLVGVVVYLLFYYQKDIVKSSKFSRWSLFVLLLLIALAGATLLFQKWNFTVDYLTGNVVTYMDTLEGKDNYYSSLQLKNDFDYTEKYELAVFNMMDFVFHHPIYFLKLAVLKVFYLLSFYRPYYTSIHNLYNAVWLAFIYTGFIYGFIKEKSKPIKAFTLTVIITNCALIAISTVDWDNRFFIPMEPVIVLYAGYGWYKIIEKASCRLKAPQALL